MSKKVTNINNFNYNNYNNNNTNDFNYYNICEDITNGVGTETSSGSGFASEEESICSLVGNLRPQIPKLWRGVKIDLFANPNPKTGIPNLKIKFNIIKMDGTVQALLGGMNSPPSYLWRGVSEQEKTQPHWMVVKDVEREFKYSHNEYKVSKLVTPQKKSITPLVCFLVEDEDFWFALLVDRGIRYLLPLKKQNAKLTESQRATNIIASEYFGKSKPNMSEVQDELGI